MSDDERLADNLRAMLARRDPGLARTDLGPELVAYVRAQSASAPNERRRRLVEALGTVATIAAVVGVAIVLAMPRQTGSLDSPGSGSFPANVPFDPVGGSGLVPRENGWPVVLIPLALVLTAGWRVRGLVGRGERLYLGAGFVALAIAGVRLATYDSVAWTDGSFAVGPASDARVGEPTARGQTRVTFTVPPEGVLTFGFDVTNTGPLPITLRGLVSTDPEFAWGRIGAVGVPPSGEVTAEVERLRPLEPTIVAPGGKLFIVIAGIASPCALGRDNTDDPNSTGAYILPVDVVYDIVGIRRVTAVQLPFEGDIPTRPDGINCLSDPGAAASDPPLAPSG